MRILDWRMRDPASQPTSQAGPCDSHVLGSLNMRGMDISITFPIPNPNGQMGSCQISGYIAGYSRIMDRVEAVEGCKLV